jgi:tRNA (cytidine/uridine-2'-O-)-methyltransferase
MSDAGIEGHSQADARERLYFPIIRRSGELCELGWLRQRLGDGRAVFSLILFEPEIPPNTGNIIRLCANVGARLHLVHPLGFELDEPRVKRAGLDYHELTCVTEHETFENCLAEIRANRLFALSTKGHRSVYDESFAAGDAFVLGPETRGLPDSVLARFDPKAVLRIPMRAGNRSLNLSNAAAVVLYEAWRQIAFSGGS